MRSPGRCLLIVLLFACGPPAGKDRCETTADCIEGFFCDDGRCAEVDQAGRCTLSLDGEDGCDAASVCADVGGGLDPPELRCTSMPDCPLLAPCAGPFESGVCNDDLLPGKERRCLVGLCRSSQDCSSSTACVIPAGAALGVCGTGQDGHPCVDDADCAPSHVCIPAEAGAPLGACRFSGDAGTCEDSGGVCVEPLAPCPDGRVEDLGRSCVTFGDTCCL